MCAPRSRRYRIGLCFASAVAYASGSAGVTDSAPASPSASSSVTSAEIPSECIRTLSEMIAKRDVKLAPYVLATGKQLPNDAGKYSACMGLPSSRYFLLSFVARGTNSSWPMKLGICLPVSCSHADVHAMTNTLILAALVNPAINSYGSLENVISTSPDLDVSSVDLGFFLALSVVGLLSMLVGVSTLVVAFCSPPGVEGVLAASGRQPPPTFVSASERSMHSPDLRQDLERPSAPPDSLTAPRGAPLLANGLDPEPESPNGASRPLPLVVRAFSLVGPTGSWPKLFEAASAKPTDALNGMRVLSMFWIILGHTFLMPNGVSGYMNYEDVVDSPVNNDAAEDNPLMMLVIAAEQGVDTFFFLSGFLLAHLSLKELAAKGGKFNRFHAVVLRYLRLTPSLALAMLIYYKIISYLGSGPFASQFQRSINDRCDGSWWSELTYTLNFIPFDSDKVCMGWTWYLGDDMIFFIVGILILPVFYRRKWLGWALLTTLLVASGVVTWWLIATYHLSVYTFDHHYTDYSYYAYSKPYTRIGAYLVGIAAAWVLAELEVRGATRAVLATPTRAGTRHFLAFVAFVAFGVVLFLVFIPTSDFGRHKNSWSDLTSNLYINFGRWLWAICFAVFTFACYYDCTPWVNRFLSHPLWLPPMRLTYGAYLCHPLVIKLLAGRETQFYHFSAQDLMYRFLGNIAYAYAAAIVLWCLIERPTMTLSTALLKKGRAAGPGGSAKGGVA